MFWESQDLVDNMKNLISYKIPGSEVTGIEGMPDQGYDSFQSLVTWGITMIMIGASLTCLVLLIMGGIQWITSGGDKAGIEGARNRIIYALIGLVIIFSSFLIVNVIADFFGVKLLGIPE